MEDGKTNVCKKYGPINLSVQYRLMSELKVLEMADAWLKNKPVVAFKKQEV